MDEGRSSVGACLRALGLAPQDLAGLSSVAEEFSAIKKAYFKRILVVHPDKGGDPAEFRLANESFELLRSLFESRAVPSFADAAEARKRRSGPATDAASRTARGPPQSWEYYFAAAQEEVPAYRVEPAKSGRSTCTQRGKAARRCGPGETIPKGEARIGSLNLESGSYGRWMHVKCWRVPKRIWLGLPKDGDAAAIGAALAAMNEVHFCGFNELSAEQKAQIVAHVMDPANHARNNGAGHPPDMKGRPQESAKIESGAAGSRTAGSTTETASNARDQSMPQPQRTIGMSAAAAAENPLAMVVAPSALMTSSSAQRENFVIPRPGLNGAQSGFLAGKTVVLTGVFPEVGGGAGLNLGKDRVKRMVEDFGGRVTGSVSGRTDFLIVGAEPGASKVSAARAQERCQLVALRDIVNCIQGGQDILRIREPDIQSFSTGYFGNGLRALDAAPRTAEIEDAGAFTGTSQKKPKKAKAPRARKAAPTGPSKSTATKKRKRDNTAEKDMASEMPKSSSAASISAVATRKSSRNGSARVMYHEDDKGDENDNEMLDWMPQKKQRTKRRRQD